MSSRLHQPGDQNDRPSSTPRFLLIAVTTIASLTVYGILQERVMTLPYARASAEGDGEASWALVFAEASTFGAVSRAIARGRGVSAASDEGDVFSWSMFLVFMNRWTAMVAAGTLAATLGWGGRERASSRDYAAVSMSNLMSTLCQYEVLKYLSFSVSTLAKTMKVVPVMIWGYVLDGKKFAPREYAEATMVTFGCFLFVVNRGWESAVERRYEMNAVDASLARRWAMDVGVFILVLYFVCDGFTSSYQQTMYRRHNVTATAQVFFTSTFTTMFSFIWIVFTGQMNAAVEFIFQHPTAAGDILLLSVASTVAQFSIAYTIRSYSAVVLASIMTARQFMSVLISCYIFGAPLNIIQWVGILFIATPFIAKKLLPTSSDGQSGKSFAQLKESETLDV